MAHQEQWTTIKVLAWTKDYLGTKGIENARLEAEWLLCAATGLDRVGLYLHFDKPLNDGELAAFRAMVARRARREPLQHILGTQEFCGLEFEVSPDVLIPRHDTETLVTEALIRRPEARSVLDIGTGSGCIAVALAHSLPQAAVTAIDIAPAALAVARRNAERNGATVEFLSGSLLEPVAGRSFDLIVSNPPYIPSTDIDRLEPEVRDFDPRGALDGGADGLDLYRILIPAAPAHLNPSGWLLVEVGIGQAPAVAELFKKTQEYDHPMTARDPGGIERVVGAQRKDVS
ncbi:peptide chain release factor N(5)-glutamine methyltransferase [Oryzomonas sagensis]|uniref:Release factor glutamine methyltransferase n=1 Tax=Oryzomonas sagensis TaxID=2603857 RepID=A0ABQ6TQ59_9BACT|nr:peptide chain release factor N(5)-glutamine methyltransferase [Oryzomonas sagensis]KAB0671110.1 peptide chain release factor N(5)-glutamine methyltransferase [Oryzomonas sagensis]